eukprot:gnl/TRDRNA2_/TRDRNA2_127362_c0_seq1.p1 gnl/TRDRNA2_/TRDRNA2_127362_c0~~gnl/TRDRNA2_/TRDRNA2_127362_c0_seq1.p1  ORF type:complete len:281 (-),score=80.97 gnl/TRDRNA2_/TRDRNA2_127362_c0_seq1:115-870(-)
MSDSARDAVVAAEEEVEELLEEMKEKLDELKDMEPAAKEDRAAAARELATCASMERLQRLVKENLAATGHFFAWTLHGLLKDLVEMYDGDNITEILRLLNLRASFVRNAYKLEAHGGPKRAGPVPLSWPAYELEEAALLLLKDKDGCPASAENVAQAKALLTEALEMLVPVQGASFPDVQRVAALFGRLVALPLSWEVVGENTKYKASAIAASEVTLSPPKGEKLQNRLKGAASEEPPVKKPRVGAKYSGA